MTNCVLPSIFTFFDGTISVEVHGHATREGGVGRTALSGGVGEVEYADGGAKLFVRHDPRKSWELSGEGLVPHGLWALDLGANSWDVTIPDPDDISHTPKVITVLPARPRDRWNRRTQSIGWSITLNAISPV